MNPRSISQLRELGLVEMKPTGSWGLTTSGRDFLDQLDELRGLDDRPGRPQGQEPGGRRGTVARQSGSRPRDDGRAAREAQRKRTR